MRCFILPLFCFDLDLYISQNESYKDLIAIVDENRTLNFSTDWSRVPQSIRIHIILYILSFHNRFIGTDSDPSSTELSPQHSFVLLSL